MIKHVCKIKDFICKINGNSSQEITLNSEVNHFKKKQKGVNLVESHLPCYYSKK